MKIEVNNEWWNKIFTKYTCEYYIADNGKKVGGKCENAKFNDNGICMKLKSYDIKSEVISYEKKSSYLHMKKGICVKCNEGYAFNGYGDNCYKK